MCIAILTLPGKVLERKVFDKCWRSNSHGVGYAYIDDFTGEVRVDKGFMTLDAAYNRYAQLSAKNGVNHPMLVHFRAATVGGVDRDNCHPFNVKGGAMIHNGTFWHDKAAKKSDSRMLAEMMYNELHYANLDANKAAFQKAFGYNRVAFLFKDGKYLLFSEHYNLSRGQLGQWSDGIWYSNGGWHGSYDGYYGEDEDIREIAELDNAIWSHQNPRGMK